FLEQRLGSVLGTFTETYLMLNVTQSSTGRACTPRQLNAVGAKHLFRKQTAPEAPKVAACQFDQPAQDVFSCRT
ncbi:hypothetical protein WDZ92_30025, partial [Nostoc sp. NIES-2111]